MVRIISIILAGIVTSLFYFPFVLNFFPVTNTKNLLAAAGCVLFIIRMVRERDSNVQKDFVIISFFAIAVSLAGFVSLVVNETNDYAYTTYIRSMWIWIAAAYSVVNTIRWVHGKISVQIMVNYLLGVCVFQCIIALLIDNFDFVREAVHVILPPMDFMVKVNRLYGIGAGLDVGGSRFASVLVMTAYIIISLDIVKYRNYLIWYFIGFLIVAIIGNMIARTTSVGMILAIILLLFPKVFTKSRGLASRYKKILKTFAAIVIITLPIVVYLYNTNQIFHNQIRFAFEGFFNLVEAGEWNVASNNKLRTMYIWPDNLKTWLIGDGYFDNPYYDDPYYIGPNFDGYYMATDAGYLRFIYYFGLIGLSLFSIYMIKVCSVCVNKFPFYKWMFIFLLMVNFIVWIKVSTDIFLIFTPFLVITTMEEQGCHNEYLTEKNHEDSL